MNKKKKRVRIIEILVGVILVCFATYHFFLSSSFWKIAENETKSNSQFPLLVHETRNCHQAFAEKGNHLTYCSFYRDGYTYFNVHFLTRKSSFVDYYTNEVFYSNILKKPVIFVKSTRSLNDHLDFSDRTYLLEYSWPSFRIKGHVKEPIVILQRKLLFQKTKNISPK